MANNPNVGPEPVDARPNHVREKTYKAPATPELVEDALHDLPEKAAEDKAREDMPGATDAIKARL